MIDKFINIELGQGLGQIKFGLNRDEVKELIGKADETEQFNYEDSKNELTESWHYDEYEFSLSFDKEHDWRLIGIAVSSGDFLFEDKSLIGIEQEEFLTKVSEKDFGDMELEELPIEEDVNHSLISFDAVSLNFWFEDEKLTEIQWGPFLNDEGMPVWP